MSVAPDRRQFMQQVSAGLAVMAWAHRDASAAGPPSVQATLTDLTGNSERIISYRHQEHLWQTSNGAYHLILNRGTLPPAPGLALYSSYDGGSSWVLARSFADTNDNSTSDGVLNGDDLSLVYQTSSGNVIFEKLHYDGSMRTWTVLNSETAYASSQFEAINPALDTDGRGTVWCAFDARDRVTNDVNIRMFSRTGGGSTWTDTGLIFGPTDHRSIERSARPLAMSGGMGMIFTVRETMYWATRTDTLPDNSAWTISTLFVGTPAFRTVDPYASHFSAVVDAQNNVHVVTIDNYDVFYFKRSAGSGSWTTQVQLDDDKKAAYLQGAFANGKLTAGWSVQRGRASIVQSSDSGATFQTVAYLVLPPDAPGVSYGTARVEMPTRTNGPIVMLQQYEDNGVQRLMLFKVPSS